MRMLAVARYRRHCADGQLAFCWLPQSGKAFEMVQAGEIPELFQTKYRWRTPVSRNWAVPLISTTGSMTLS